MPPTAKTLKAFLKQVPEPGIALPKLLHSTCGVRLLDVLSGMSLSTSRCQVFDEDLLYFFVGRPAYKVAQSENPDFWLLPVVFIFDAEAIAPVRRAYPFDSGAYCNGRMGNEYEPFKKETFEFSGHVNDLKKVIAAFFGTSRRYFRGEAKNYNQLAAEFSLKADAFPIFALANLLCRRRDETIDERASTIEVQVDHDVSLRTDGLKGIVLCEEWMEDRDIAREVNSLSCMVETYPILPLRADAYMSSVYEACIRVTGSE